MIRIDFIVSDSFYPLISLSLYIYIYIYAYICYKQKNRIYLNGKGGFLLPQRLLEIKSPRLHQLQRDHKHLDTLKQHIELKSAYAIKTDRQKNMHTDRQTDTQTNT